VGDGRGGRCCEVDIDTWMKRRVEMEATIRIQNSMLMMSISRDSLIQNLVLEVVSVEEGVSRGRGAESVFSLPSRC
jgi:hypothetical protein